MGTCCLIRENNLHLRGCQNVWEWVSSFLHGTSAHKRPFSALNILAQQSVRYIMLSGYINLWYKIRFQKAVFHIWLLLHLVRTELQKSSISTSAAVKKRWETFDGCLNNCLLLLLRLTTVKTCPPWNSVVAHYTTQRLPMIWMTSVNVWDKQ